MDGLPALLALPVGGSTHFAEWVLTKQDIHKENSFVKHVFTVYPNFADSEVRIVITVKGEHCELVWVRFKVS